MVLDIGATKRMILFKEPQPLNKYSRMNQKDELLTFAVGSRPNLYVANAVDVEKVRS